MDCEFNVGDIVKIEHGGSLVEAVVIAIVIEIRGEVNVFYRLHSDAAELDYPLVIEEYLVNAVSRSDRQAQD